MDLKKITVIAGISGSGKTTWIHQQLNEMNPNCIKDVLYFSPGVGSTPIDGKRLVAELPFLKVFGDGQEAEFIQGLDSADVAFIEMGFYLEIAAVEQILDKRLFL